MKKPALEVIFYSDFIMTQNDGLPKKTFLHPDSDKDYYKRSSKKDLLGKSRKNLSYVVPVQKLDERLKDVLWTKLKSMLPDLNSFDCKEITDKLEKKFLDARLPDEKTLNEDLRQKVDKKLQKFHPDKLWIVNSFVNKVGRLTSNQEKEIADLFTKFEKQTNTEATSVPKNSSPTLDNKLRTKTKGELKDTSQSRSTEESTSDEDGDLGHHLTTTKGKKQTQKLKVTQSKSIEESSMNDKETLHQELRTTKRKKQTQEAKESSEESESDYEETLQQESRSKKGRKQKQKPILVPAKSMKKPPSNAEDSLVKESSSRKRTQNAKREPKDDPSKVKSSRKRPRLMKEEQTIEDSPNLKQVEDTIDF
jgi:hypothetical protein